MDNFQIAEYFNLLSKLMDIHGENSFKAKHYAAAAFNIEKLAVQLSETAPDKLFSLKGLGESSGQKILELLETGQISVLTELLQKTPEGVLEMLQIKGIGPKKISVIWKEMQIETIGELLYACQENRLKNYKGFGEKTQQNIIETIEYYFKNKGSFLYAQVEIVFNDIKNYVEKIFAPHAIKCTGGYIRQFPVIDELAFVVAANREFIQKKMISANPPELLELTENSILYKLQNGLRLRFLIAETNFNKTYFIHSAGPAFVAALENKFPSLDLNQDEISLFNNAGIPFIPAYARETSAIIEQTKQPVTIQPSDIKGIIHSHSNWSDGTNTIEEMAKAAIAKGLEYLVISDHSKAAFYANGLNEERIKEQHRYIDELNQQLAPFKIFKSIECDILNDGNLDYSNAILSTFDLVITSIHSNLKMTEEKAMLRLMTAIQNPYTTILGHMTGRLLLSRKGYPVNHHTIIDACAAHQVVIELNAHPNRLDIDWQFIEYALEKKVLISINPDAHTIEGFDDTKYGVLVAQKALLSSAQNLSSYSLAAFEAYLEQIKRAKGI
ncbi:MAG: helix-hairpin-helix domain-containing protein [Ferruginibacter sp.]